MRLRCFLSFCNGSIKPHIISITVRKHNFWMLGFFFKFQYIQPTYCTYYLKTVLYVGELVLGKSVQSITTVTVFAFYNCSTQFILESNFVILFY